MGPNLGHGAFWTHWVEGTWAQKCFPKGPLLGRPNLFADKASDASADKTSDAAQTAAVSADKTSVVSRGIPMALRRRPQRGRVGNGVGMSWETTDVVSADTTDVLAADTRDVLPADTTHVLPADKFGVGNPTFANYF